MKAYITDNPTIIIYYDEKKLDVIRDIDFSEEELYEEIQRKSSACDFYTRDGHSVQYQWSSDIEFADHVGGGINIEVIGGESIYSDDPIVIVCAESYDSYAEAHGLERCKDDTVQLKLAIIQLKSFIRNI